MKVIELLKEKRLRDKIKIIVGGAFCHSSNFESAGIAFEWRLLIHEQSCTQRIDVWT